MKLQSYNLKVHYITGKTNTLADAASRFPVEDYEEPSGEAAFDLKDCMQTPSALYMQRAAITAVDVLIEAKACEVCGDTEDKEGDDGLLCDRCDKAYHPHCLTKEKREEAEYPYWFCDDCLNHVR